jgi:hypothetical protein
MSIYLRQLRHIYVPFVKQTDARNEAVHLQKYFCN